MRGSGYRHCHNVNLITFFKQVPDIETYAVDLSDWDKAQGLVYSLGQIDLLVNNAGAYMISPFLEATKEDLDLLVCSFCFLF